MSSRAAFSARPVLADLRPFQRTTVDHVVDRFYEAGDARRFLVADDTGLGKSLIARGVIARTIERLQNDDDVNRIDIVYVCSNADVARQNVNRLNVVGTEVPLPTRLSLLAAGAADLDTPPVVGAKPVNLVPLTPKTSFEKGWRTGLIDERALLMILLDDQLGFGRSERTAAYRIFQGGVKDWRRFRDHTRRFEVQHAGHLDTRIVKTFMRSVRQAGTDRTSPLHRFRVLLADTAGRPSVPGGTEAAAQIVGELRSHLARAGVEALEPNLVILDEFQRFSDLLDERTEAGELAHALFGYMQARVLLLSATPFRSFTSLDEDTADASGGHLAQFRQTVDFLAKGGRDAAAVDRIEKLLKDFRDNITRGTEPRTETRELRSELLNLMCRTERPVAATRAMVSETVTTADTVSVEAVRQYLGFARMADHLGTGFPLDVWKSVPHVLHFMDAYQLGRKMRDAIADNDDYTLAIVESLSRIDSDVVRRFEEIPADNTRMSALISSTTEAGWQRLLWVPASLPYFTPGGAYSDPAVTTITKKLIFSSWSAAPTAVASLLSYDASRRIASASDVRVRNTPDGLRRVRPRLRLRMQNRRPSAMTSLIPFVPLPELAERGDPLLLRDGASRTVHAATAERTLASELRRALPRHRKLSEASEYASLTWQWPITLAGKGFDEALEGLGVDGCAHALSGATQGDSLITDPMQDTPDALAHYVAELLTARTRAVDLTRTPKNLTVEVARIAIHSPANCAWRALGRLPVDLSNVTSGGRWAAAAIIAAGFRTLFNRWESTLLLNQLYPDETSYWQRVLRYCADGNLQAVLDEYLYHLVGVEGQRVFDDQVIQAFAVTASNALRLTSANYRAKDPLQSGDDIEFHARFAMRYGDAKPDEQSARPSEIRAAFNSPFWPFVLVSTSVGQEGIDFHPWCHHLLHWNVPSNPVDFEQRDGRVNRFRGHALRRNIAHAYGREMRGSSTPWDEGYWLARAEHHESEVKGLAPDWVYPGPYTVVREVMAYRMSTDLARLDQMHHRVALYRLAFGQPRQEDLLELIEASGVSAEDAERWRVDLRP
ncbi:helicase-related protein [Gordonia sp. VNK1]|uniref:helicase-related protein n=1 Tax=Gordonia oleivorans TaxID=3156618 RepID=UPI0032B5FCE3